MKEIKTNSYSNLTEAAKKMKSEDPCWEGYKMIGTKPGKNGKPAPNCVPDKDKKASVVEAASKKMKGEDPCWEGYQMIGTKKGKGGKEVPNCVPKKKTKKASQSFEEWANQELGEEHHKDSLEDGVMTFDEWANDEMNEPEHAAMGENFSFENWADEEMHEEEEHAQHEHEDTEHEHNHMHEHEKPAHMHIEFELPEGADFDGMLENFDLDTENFDLHAPEYETIFMKSEPEEAEEYEDDDFEYGDEEDEDFEDEDEDYEDEFDDEYEDEDEDEQDVDFESLDYDDDLMDEDFGHKSAMSKSAKKTPAWQRSEGKNKAGGLNEKGRKSYNRETGGHLKAPVTEKKPTGKRKKRRKSFCARMKGMKKKLTSKETARDPNSRINKALRKWNC